MHVKDLCRIAHMESRKMGWYDGQDRDLTEMIAPIHSEVSEMLEAIRKTDPETGGIKWSSKTPEFTCLEEEAADTAIRLGDFCEYQGLALENAVSALLGYIQSRFHAGYDDFRLKPDSSQAPGIVLARLHGDLSRLFDLIIGEGLEIAEDQSTRIPDFSMAEEKAALFMIRLTAFCESMGCRLEDAISAKMAFNRTRGHRHGGLAF